jgi:hypothetical protein
MLKRRAATESRFCCTLWTYSDDVFVGERGEWRDVAVERARFCRARFHDAWIEC